MILLVLVAGTVSAHDWHSVWIGPVTMTDLRMLEADGFLVEGLFGNKARLYVDNEEEEMLRHLGYTPIAEERHEPLVPYPSLSEIYSAIDAVGKLADRLGISTEALTDATLPYVRKLAEHGLDALKRDEALAAGASTIDGRLVCEAVSKAQGLDYTPLAEMLS